MIHFGHAGRRESGDSFMDRQFKSLMALSFKGLKVSVSSVFRLYNNVFRKGVCYGFPAKL